MSEANNSETPKPEEETTADISSEALQKKLNDLQALAEKYKTDYLYLRADFDNYKKHVIKERADYLKYGSERILVEMLSVFDNFERALETQITSENFSNFVKGVELTAVEFKAVLQKSGLTEVPALGLAFDPMIHEALGAEEAKQIPSGHIMRVFKKPYKLYDKLIRPGQVVVAR